MNIGICDDEEEILVFLSRTITEIMRDCKQDIQIYLYHSGEKLLQENVVLDILFLDIEMPGMDGIETGRRFREQHSECRIIMATSKIERFKEAFKINAFRFITKPFQKDEIREALNDVTEAMLGFKKLEVYKKRVKYAVLQKNISYIISVDSYVELHVKEEIFRSELSLNRLEKELEPKLFCRVNRQCIVNLEWIESYKKGEVHIGGNRIKVSLRRKTEFEKRKIIYDMEYR